MSLYCDIVMLSYCIESLLPQVIKRSRACFKSDSLILDLGMRRSLSPVAGGAVCDNLKYFSCAAIDSKHLLSDTP